MIFWVLISDLKSVTCDFDFKKKERKKARKLQKNTPHGKMNKKFNVRLSVYSVY